MKKIRFSYAEVVSADAVEDAVEEISKLISGQPPRFTNMEGSAIIAGLLRRLLANCPNERVRRDVAYAWCASFLSEFEK